MPSCLISDRQQLPSAAAFVEARPRAEDLLHERGLVMLAFIAIMEGDTMAVMAYTALGEQQAYTIIGERIKNTICQATIGGAGVREAADVLAGNG